MSSHLGASSTTFWFLLWTEHSLSLSHRAFPCLSARTWRKRTEAEPHPQIRFNKRFRALTSADVLSGLLGEQRGRWVNSSRARLVQQLNLHHEASRVSPSDSWDLMGLKPGLRLDLAEL